MDSVNAEVEKRILLYLQANKILAVTPEFFKKGKKTISCETIAKDFCIANDEFEKYESHLLHIKNICKKNFEKAKNSKIQVNTGDVSFYTDQRSQKRLKQIFFCENPNEKGYILTPFENTYLVSDDPVNLNIFKKDLNFLGENVYEEWARQNLIIGSMQYKPWANTLELNESDVYLLNTYVKPEWVKKIKSNCQWGSVHPLIRCFYEHLFPNSEQRVYALNWIACSIQCTRLKRDKPKLSTYLTLIGDTGLGKGICIEHHMRYLHGTLNYMEDKTKNIGERFTISSYLKKTLVHFSEAAIKDEDAYDALKSLESVYQGVEPKHGTATLKKTYFNVVWACNHLNRMRYLDPDDRRFAILDITSDKLYNKRCFDSVTQEEVVFDDANINKLIYDEEVLISFAEYLLGLEPDFKKAEKPMKNTQRYKEVMLCSRPEWVVETVLLLNNIDWESPSGSLDKIGYKELTPVSERDLFYTYEVPINVVMRIVEQITKSYKIRVSKRKTMEELKKYPADQIYCCIKDGYFKGVKIRHQDHESKLQTIKSKNV